jgi:hypothetical protein
MRLLSTVFLILVCCGAMRPASAQTIPYVSTPCVGCTTQAQLTTAATTFFTQYLAELVGPFPQVPGYTGVVASPTSPNRACTRPVRRRGTENSHKNVNPAVAYRRNMAG